MAPRTSPLSCVRTRPSLGLSECNQMENQKEEIETLRSEVNFSSYELLSSLEFSDTQVYEP